MSVPLLDISNLSVRFAARDGMVHALDSVSYAVEPREALALVGESGSGKSVSAFAVMGILGPSAQVTANRISLGGVDLLAGGRKALKDVRGNKVAMVFQNARGALNPIRPIGRQLMDTLWRHQRLKGSRAREAAIEALAQVRIPDPARRFDAYPFEISGGMCQRVMIAIALACKPALLIADEPTTGLDVTTQAAIMDLISAKAAEQGMGLLLITHDLGLARDHCDSITVMHAGHVVETGKTERLFDAPAHPYTAGLIAATPTEGTLLESLSPIPGGLPDLRGDLPPCRFSGRCTRRSDICDISPLPTVDVAQRHTTACHHPEIAQKARASA